MEKVTVIVPVYNAECGLDKCIGSLVNQTFYNLDILLMDDGSGDSSGVICDKWAEKDARIRVVHQENSGVSKTRNNGIEKAQGDYIVFVDSDDYVEPDYVQCMMDNRESGRVTVVGYCLEVLREKRCITTPVVLEKESARTLLSGKEIVKLYDGRLSNAIWNKLYETKILRKQGIRFEEEMSLGEDILFNLNYNRNAEAGFCVVNKPLYHYIRTGGESLDNKYLPNFASTQQRIYGAFINYLHEIEADEEGIMQMYAAYFAALVVAIDNLYQGRSKLEREEYATAMRELKQEPEFDRTMENLRGKQRMICAVRLWGIRHGLYKLDFSLREVVKKMIGVK